MCVYFLQGKLGLHPVEFAFSNSGFCKIFLNTLLLPAEISIPALFTFVEVYLKRRVKSRQCWDNSKKVSLGNKCKLLVCHNTKWRPKLTFQRLNFLLFYFRVANIETWTDTHFFRYFFTDDYCKQNKMLSISRAEQCLCMTAMLIF